MRSLLGRFLIPFGAVILFSPLASASFAGYTSSTAFAAATNVDLVENYGTLTNGQLINPGTTVDQLTYSNFVLTGDPDGYSLMASLP